MPKIFKIIRKWVLRLSVTALNFWQTKKIIYIPFNMFCTFSVNSLDVTKSMSKYMWFFFLFFVMNDMVI